MARDDDFIERLKNPPSLLYPGLREDLDKELARVNAMAAKLGLRPIRLPGPPGAARTEEQRAARHGGTPPPRGTGWRRLLDPLGLFR